MTRKCWSQRIGACPVQKRRIYKLTQPLICKVKTLNAKFYYSKNKLYAYKVSYKVSYYMFPRISILYIQHQVGQAWFVSRGKMNCHGKLVHPVHHLTWSMLVEPSGTSGELSLWRVSMSMRQSCEGGSKPVSFGNRMLQSRHGKHGRPGTFETSMAWFKTADALFLFSSHGNTWGKPNSNSPSLAKRQAKQLHEHPYSIV